jgi:hypothetical protein
MRFDPRNQREAKRLWRSRLPNSDRYVGRERSRRMAEFFEGVPKDSDYDGYGYARKPFGTGLTGGALLRWLRRRAS